MDLEPDSLENDIAASIAEVNKSPGGGPPADAPPSGDKPDPPPSPAPSEGERARDDAGRFAKKDEAKPTEAKSPFAKAAEKPAEAKDAAAKPEGAAEQPKPPAGTTIAPPANWKGAAKVAWQSLAPEVQQALADDYKGLGEQQSRYSRLETVLTPDRVQNFVAHHGSVEAGLNSLLTISDMATRDAPGFVRWFMQQRGLNPQQLFGQGGNPDGATPPTDQASNPLEREVIQLRQDLHGLRQHLTQASQAPLAAELQRFAADPAHPYFNDVRPLMGSLLGTGQAKDLQQAYDMAVNAHPQIRIAIRDAERRKEADEAAKVAQAARLTQASITGSPSGAKVPDHEPDEDLETTIRNARRRVVGGAI